MKLSLLLLAPLLTKAFIITHNNDAPAMNIANDEIICRYFSFPLLETIRSDPFSYLGKENKNAFILKKKSEYSCGIQIKFSAFNKYGVGYTEANYLNYEFLQLTAIRKENCYNNKAIVFCDHRTYCEVYKTICCEDNLCNDYDNINFTKDLYLFNKQKFVNDTINEVCDNLYSSAYTFSLNYKNIKNRKNATCSIIGFKKNALPTNNIITKTNKITSEINLAEDEMICSFCTFPMFVNKPNYNKEYQEQCDNTTFIIAKKSSYYCGLRGYTYNLIFLVLSKTGGLNVGIVLFLIGIIKKDKCRRQDYSIFCNIKNAKFPSNKKAFVCCQKNNCNAYNNIIFSADVYSYAKKKFLKNTTTESPGTLPHKDDILCTFMKFNTSKINELPAIEDKSENTNKNMCDCNNQDNLVSSYANLVILVLSTFFYNIN